MYPVIIVPAGAASLTEALGTKPKFWFEDSQQRLVLYKEGRRDTGEHWAEKVCCEICSLLGIPHATYDLAEWRGRRGVVSPTFVPKGARLVLANELLAKLIPGYANVQRYQAREHTVRVAMAILGVQDVRLPLGWVMRGE